MNLLKNALTSGQVEGFCIIKSVEQRTTQRGQVYLDLVLSDAAGDINAKLWDYSEARFGKYEANDVIKVRGTVDTWNNMPQLRVDRIRIANDADDYKYEEYKGFYRGFHQNNECSDCCTDICAGDGNKRCECDECTDHRSVGEF